MLRSESVIALAIMGLSAYFMWHALVLPIGWVEGQGPGGGAFPFWLSLVMFLAATGVWIKALAARRVSTGPFFDPDMFGSVASVVAALIVTVALMSFAGTYLALTAFLIWYLRFFGGHGWRLTLTVVVGTLLVLFFFFEVTLRILMPKGFTEPLFLPLYRIFF